MSKAVSVSYTNSKLKSKCRQLAARYVLLISFLRHESDTND